LYNFSRYIKIEYDIGDFDLDQQVEEEDDEQSDHKTFVKSKKHEFYKDFYDFY
jgi:hypothetical protein